MRRAQPFPPPAPASETRSANIGGREINFTLVRCRCRSIGFRVDDGGLTVRLPLHASRRWLAAALDEHAAWILRKLDQWSHRPRPPSWDGAGVFPLLGREYVLAPGPDGGHRMEPLRGGQRPLPFAQGLAEGDVERLVGTWYREQALACFRERAEVYAARLGIAPPPLRLSGARSQWGSCSRTGGIRVSWRLIMFPLPVVDYVVAHELAHLIEMNHSPAFWRTVERIYPDHRAARRELAALG
ncbi:MAG TPA: SprT family zinc-dependent metalloprotease [Burkholderiales bacterium]